MKTILFCLTIIHIFALHSMENRNNSQSLNIENFQAVPTQNMIIYTKEPNSEFDMAPIRVRVAHTVIFNTVTKVYYGYIEYGDQGQESYLKKRLDPNDAQKLFNEALQRSKYSHT